MGSEMCIRDSSSVVSRGCSSLLTAMGWALRCGTSTATISVASLAAAKLARILGGASAGVPPRIMGIGPVPATRRLCERLKLTPQKFSVIELNEAFASQALAVLRQLGIDDAAEHVNANGGAIALGHPLGMSGARITGSAALELKSSGDIALATMCVGVGQGISIAIEKI